MVGATILVTLLAAQFGPQEPGLVDFDRLIELYQQYDLPMPPAGSELVLVPSEPLDGRPTFAVAFRYGDESARRYLFGVQTGERLYYSETKPFESADDVDVEQLSSAPPTLDGPYQTYVTENVLATAIQLAILGDLPKAQKLVQLNDRTPSLNTFRRFSYGNNAYFAVPEDATLEQRATYLALHYHLNRWGDAESDRADVAKTVDTILSSLSLEPNPFRKEILAGMRRAAEEPVARDDRVLELIDSMLDVRSYRVFDDDLRTWRSGYEGEAELIAMGDAALLMLVNYLDDSRWTKTSHIGGFYVLSRYETVGEFVSSMIEKIAPEAFHEPSRLVTRSSVLGYLEWQETGKREAFLKSLLVPESLQPPSGYADNSPDHNAAEELLNSYPDVFEQAYLEIARHNPHIRISWFTTLVIEESGWQDERMRKLFSAAAKSQKNPGSYGPLDALRQYDPVEFQRLLIVNLQSLPLRRMEPEELWSAGWLAEVAMLHGGTEAWAVLQKRIEKVRPEARALMLEDMVRNYGNLEGQKHMRARKLFLSLLDDTSVLEIEDELVRYWFYGRDEVTGRTIRDMLAIELYDWFFDTRRDEFDLSNEGLAKMRSEVRDMLKSGSSGAIPGRERIR